MTRSYLLSLLILFHFFTVAGQTTPPNIILIIVDDLGYSDLASYGNKNIQTPHIDALGTQKYALFRNAKGSFGRCSVLLSSFFSTLFSSPGTGFGLSVWAATDSGRTMKTAIKSAIC